MFCNKKQKTINNKIKNMDENNEIIDTKETNDLINYDLIKHETYYNPNSNIIKKFDYIDNNKNYLNINIDDHIINRYQIISKLGKGAFSNVIEVYDHKRKQDNAIKIIRNEPRFARVAKTEYNILLKIYDNYLINKNKYDFIPLLINKGFIYNNHVCFVFNLYKNNLYETICKNTINNNDIINYSKDILKGLEFIKDLNIIHCDLKPENIIIEKKRAIIIDYGSSIFYNKIINNTYIQSRFYRAPECLFDIKEFISYEIDIWSFGCILYEMYKKKPLFPGKNEDNMTFHIKSILGKPNKNYIDNLFNNNIKGKRCFSSNLSETTYNSKKYLLETEDSFELLIFNLIKKCLKYHPLERYTPKQSLDYLAKNIYI
jgi:dual specificity tyrosine-phosphorylation-regulated kinase 2/3/4